MNTAKNYSETLKGKYAGRLCSAVRQAHAIFAPTIGCCLKMDNQQGFTYGNFRIQLSGIGINAATKQFAGMITVW